MRGVNKVILVGNLGKDPEVNYLEGGAAVARFTLATNDGYIDRNGNRVDQTEWHNIVLWRKQAEIAEKYLRKGSKIYLEGKIRSRSWEDNGVKKYTTEIVGDSFIMLDKKEDGSDSGSQAYGGNQSYSGGQSSSGGAPSRPAQQQNEPAGGQSSPDTDDSYEDDLPF